MLSLCMGHQIELQPFSSIHSDFGNANWLRQDNAFVTMWQHMDLLAHQLKYCSAALMEWHIPFILPASIAFLCKWVCSVEWQFRKFSNVRIEQFSGLHRIQCVLLTMSFFCCNAQVWYAFTVVLFHFGFVPVGAEQAFPVGTPDEDIERDTEGSTWN